MLCSTTASEVQITLGSRSNFEVLAEAGYLRGDCCHGVPRVGLAAVADVDLCQLIELLALIAAGLEFVLSLDLLAAGVFAVLLLKQLPEHSFLGNFRLMLSW